MTDIEHLTIGMIGAGRVAQALTPLARAAGHRVILSNSRGPESLTELAKQLDAEAGTVAEAARADVVVLAVGWDQVPAAVRDLTWSGQIVIDPTNQWYHHDPQQVVDLGDQTGSEYIASLLPGARVVKVFNTIYLGTVTERAHQQQPLVIFLAGDDAEAKSTVTAVISSLGLAPIDLGSLRDGGRLMQARGPLNSLHLLKIN